MKTAKKFRETIADLHPSEARKHVVVQSQALQEAVVAAVRLQENEWIDHWHNPDCSKPHVFSFHFWKRLAPLGRDRSMFVRMDLTLDADLDLSVELRRLAHEVQEYRACANRVYGVDKAVPR